MRKCIKHNIDIVTVHNSPNYLVSIVNPKYYHLVCNEGTGIVADAYICFVDALLQRKLLLVVGTAFGIIVNLLPHIELLIYSKPMLLMVGITNVHGIIFYQVYLLTWITIPSPFLKPGAV